MPLHSDSPSRFSSSTSGIKSFQDKVTHAFRPIARQPRSEDTDSEDDCFSGITTNSKKSNEDSSTNSNSVDNRQGKCQRIMHILFKSLTDIFKLHVKTK